jgi:hypothetical protein
MKYNTQREAIIIREYGRSIQRYINYAKQLPTKEERQKAAESIIQMMTILNPQNKHTADYKQKLWDHLHLMANFELDVDSPFPIPEPKALQAKPKRLPYPGSRIRMRHYGKHVEKLIEKAANIDDVEKKDELVQIIANFMKLAYKNWSNEEVSNDLIREDLRTLSLGKLRVSDDMHIEIKVSPNAPGQGQSNPNRKKNKQKHRNKTGFNRGGGQGGNNKRFR